MKDGAAPMIQTFVIAAMAYSVGVMTGILVVGMCKVSANAELRDEILRLRDILNTNRNGRADGRNVSRYC